MEKTVTPSCSYSGKQSLKQQKNDYHPTTLYLENPKYYSGSMKFNIQMIVFILQKIFISSMQFILTSASPSLHSSQSLPPPHTQTSPLSQIYYSSLSIQKRTGFLGISTKHCITYNKTRHLPSYQGQMRQPSRRKNPKSGQKSQRKPFSHTYKCHKHPKFNNHSMLAQLPIL